MTTTLQRPPITSLPAPEPHTPVQVPTERHRLREWARRHGRTALWLGPVLLIAGLVQGINMGGSPQRFDDEGTYTAQAWAIDNLGALTHYTYWYDHPPLGWIQIAGYAELTGAFNRYSEAVIAGREATLVATLISVVLLFFLARRLMFRRATAAAAGFVFAVSPLAVQFHRSVYLDNIATPWLLGAFLLALTRKHQLAGFAGSAAAFGVAVLSKETYLLALPFLAWAMWRSASPETRRYTLSVAASILTLIGFSYVLLALVKGELFPGPHHDSLISGIAFQLGTRTSSGSVFDPNSLINKVLGEWWQLDPVILVLGSAASVVALFIRRLRPFAAMMVFLLIMMFRPGGYLPVPYIIMLLPFLAMLIAGVTETMLRRWKHPAGTDRERLFRRAPIVVWSMLTAAAVVVAGPIWFTQLRGFLLSDLDQPTAQAEAWVEANVPHSARLVIDDSMWVDFVRAGFPRDNVVWYYKVDTDPAVEAQSPDGWRDYSYVITTDSMRTFPGAYPRVDAALKNSVLVAKFGSGSQAVDVQRVDSAGSKAAASARTANAALAKSAGTDLAANPRLNASAALRTALSTGAVDDRVSVVLGQLLAAEPVTVTGFPTVAGDQNTLARQVLITSVGGDSTVGDTSRARRVATQLRQTSGAFAPEHVRQTSEGLHVMFAPAPFGTTSDN